MRCWRWIISAGAVVVLSACGGDEPAPQSVQESSVPLPQESTAPSIQIESNRDDIEAGTSWQSTANEDELVAFVGIDRRSVVVGSTDGRVFGSADFDAQVEVEAFPAINRIAVRDTEGSIVWILDTSTGQVVDEFDGLGDLGAVYSKDGVFLGEVVDGYIDGEGSVTIRETQTGTQRFYASAEPGWVLAGDGVVFARSTDLAAIPTSSTSSDTHALMIASAATGELVAFTGPEAHSFVGWIGPSCWLSRTTETLVVHCIDSGSIESILELDAEAMSGSGPAEIDPDHASIAGLGPLALSLPPLTDGNRRLVVGSLPTGLIEVQSGSFPRWSPSGRFLAVAVTDALLVLAPNGSVMASYDEVAGRPVWTASGAS